ncbi:MAG: glycine cleavage system protein GcvH [Pseudomonadales bacterium]|nr:glycine cleavage system protein GcvH [Pseudomonadales bacterium]
MSNFPDDLKYAASHEWVKVDDNGVATVGISDHAQDALGDIVFVELPELGATVNAKQEVAVVESVKAASDVYSPVSGEVTEVNDTLLDAPETVNSSPYDNGWFFKVQLSDEAELELDELMDAEAYSDHCDDE